MYFFLIKNREKVCFSAIMEDKPANHRKYKLLESSYVFIDVWTILFTFVCQLSSNIMSHSLSHRLKMASKITAGLFRTDSNKATWGRVWQFLSRFTWELPQTLSGWLFTSVRALAGQVDRVDVLGGIFVRFSKNRPKTGNVRDQKRLPKGRESWGCLVVRPTECYQALLAQFGKFFLGCLIAFFCSISEPKNCRLSVLFDRFTHKIPF